MFLNIILLSAALSVDIFVSCAAYGFNDMVLSAKKIAVLNRICSLCLGISLLLGRLLDNWIPEKYTREICFYSLLFLGCMKLADSGIRQYLRRRESVHRNIQFALSQFHFIISIYSNPMEADADGNHSLSWREVVFFSLAMSMDCLISGAMAAFMKLSVSLAMAVLFLLGEAAAYMGFWIGRKLNNHCPGDISWVGGVIFIVLAVLKR